MDIEGLLGNPMLQIGLGILANNNQRGQFAPAFGQGTMQGLQNVQQFKQQQQRNDFLQQQQAMQKAQYDQQQSDREDAKRQRELRELTFGTVAEKYNVPKELMSAFPQIGEDLLKNQLLPKAKKIGFTPNGMAYDENNPELQLGQSYAKAEDSGLNPNKPFMMVDGKIVPNEAYQNYEINKAKAGAANNNLSVGFPKEQFKNERDLRNDFQGLPTTKAFREVQTSYDQITTALKNPSAANDLAAATKFMKLLDPGSVVRESELGMAMAATGQIDRMSNYLNQLQTGEKLTPSQRKDFAESASQLYGAATNRYNESATEYQQMAKDYELNPERIAKPVTEVKPVSNKKPPMKGQVVDGYKFKGGNPADPNNWTAK